MSLKHVRLSLLSLFLLPGLLFANDGKVNLSTGYFSLRANANGNTSNIANFSVFKMGYQHPILDRFELTGAYTILMGDYSGSDLGYGLDIGAHYYPFTFSNDEKFKDDQIEVRRFQNYYPFIGLGFFQRQFQSVKNSYAGPGLSAGLEKYYDKRINFKAEFRFISLAGANQSSADEMNFLFGIVYKL